MSVTYRGYSGPLPHPDFRRMVADEVLPPFVGSISGEFNGTTTLMLGVARFPGKIKDVNLSLGESGYHASAGPNIAVDVRINGTSALGTKPEIAAPTSASVQVTTFTEAADTGVTNTVLTSTLANRTFAVGDVLTALVTYSGQASPTKKMADLFVIVECEPLG